MRFLATFLISLAVLCSAYLGIVRTVDARGDFATGIFPQLTLDARRQKMALFKRYQRNGPVRCLILGSSRSMKLDPTLARAATGMRSFNFGVESATIEDFLALSEWTRSQGCIPRLVVIGLDVEALRDGDVLDDKLESNPDLLHAYERTVGQSTGRFEDLKATVSLNKGTFTGPYLQDTAKSARLKMLPPKDLIPFRQFRSDGFVIYPKWEWNRRHGSFDLRHNIAASAQSYTQIHKGIHGLSPRRRHLLEQLVRDIQREGAEVRIWLTPLHPQALAVLRAKTEYQRRLIEVRAFVNYLAARTHIHVYDFSEIALYHGSTTEWYDGSHTDDRGSAAILRAILRPRP